MRIAPNLPKRAGFKAIVMFSVGVANAVGSTGTYELGAMELEFASFAFAYKLAHRGAITIRSAYNVSLALW
ncbi:hypothetical protein CPT32_28315 [Rhizobium sophoriradicis]|nr:hypothetical protein CPT32_28315 [Rhizobium sophoriradicis]